MGLENHGPISTRAQWSGWAVDPTLPQDPCSSPIATIDRPKFGAARLGWPPCPLFLGPKKLGPSYTFHWKGYCVIYARIQFPGRNALFSQDTICLQGTLHIEKNIWLLQRKAILFVKETAVQLFHGNGFWERTLHSTKELLHVCNRYPYMF